MSSQTNQTLDQTDTETDKGHDNEHEQQRLTSDHVDKGSHPGNSLSNKQSHLRKDFCHNSNPPLLQTNQTLDQADTEADKGHDNEHQDQRIAGDHSDERPNPRDSGSDQGGHRFQNSGNSNSSRSDYLLSNQNVKKRDAKRKLYFKRCAPLKNLVMNVNDPLE